MSFRLDAEHLGHDVGEDRVRALADVGGPARDGDAAAPVRVHHHPRVRHVVPVDGEPRARHVGRAGDADPPPGGSLPRLLVPAGRFHHPVDALGEPRRRHREVIRRLGEGPGGERRRHRRIEAEVIGGLVDVALQREARLRRAVARLGPQGGLFVKTRTPSNL